MDFLITNNILVVLSISFTIDHFGHDDLLCTFTQMCKKNKVMVIAKLHYPNHVPNYEFHDLSLLSSCTGLDLSSSWAQERLEALKC